MSNLFSQSQQIELRGYMRINILSTLQRFVTNNKVVFVNRSRPPRAQLWWPTLICEVRIQDFLEGCRERSFSHHFNDDLLCESPKERQRALQGREGMRKQEPRGTYTWDQRQLVCCCTASSLPHLPQRMRGGSHLTAAWVVSDLAKLSLSFPISRAKVLAFLGNTCGWSRRWMTKFEFLFYARKVDLWLSRWML